MAKRKKIAISDYQPKKGLASRFVHPLLGEFNLENLTKSQIQVLEKEGLLTRKPSKEESK